jgi:hypothetical protein
MKISKRLLIILICSAVTICVATGSTLAYIFAKTDNRENRFEPVFVSCDVEEKFDGNTKSNVIIRNTGDIEAYIRATFVVTWVSDSGAVHSSLPVEGQDYSLVLGSSKWLKGTDGFYYYTMPVHPGEATDVLISSIAPLVEGPDGYSLSVHIASTAIQSKPISAVNEAWGASVNENNILTAP